MVHSMLNKHNDAPQETKQNKIQHILLILFMHLAFLCCSLLTNWDFMSVADLEGQLKAYERQLDEDTSLPDVAGLDYRATIRRVDMIRRVRKSLEAPINVM